MVTSMYFSGIGNEWVLKIYTAKLEQTCMHRAIHIS